MAETDPSGPSGLKTTPLDRIHRGRNAKMVDFAGYAMPVQYGRGIIHEHRHTRTAAGLFDVSHMGQVRISGADAIEAFETLVPADLKRLEHGQCQYSMLTNEKGGVIDDLIVTSMGGYLFVVLNASRKEIDIAHIKAAIGKTCEIEVLEDRALIALQGPKAADVLGRHAAPAKHLPYMNANNIKVGEYPCLITRSGYTGEDGFEISAAAEDARDLAEILLAENEVEPIGLGARDSLRLEAGFCLYGNELDETTTPVEAGLTWAVGKRRREEGGFPGAETILAQIKNGPPRKRVGLKLQGKAPARAGTEIQNAGGDVIGHVTSGGFGAAVEGPIAMGYVHTGEAGVGGAVRLMVRSKALEAEIVKMPFVPDTRPKA
ncbi:MAG: glycine cleavage system aminomethyltransferase GcvT [Rhodospirillales bacterium]